MGIFDALFGGEEKQVLRQCRRVSNRNAQPEDREAAARWLFENGSEQAIYGLLGRFDVSIENQMKDANEKEFVFQLLVELGPPVVEPARTYVKRCKSIALPLRLLGAVGGRDVLLTTVMELLDVEAQREDFKADRKRQLLILLAEHRDPRILPSAARFLGDFDEGVRYASAEAIIAQEDESAREPLLEALANVDEESNRLRARIADAFVSRRWSLGDRAEAVAGAPPAGYAVRGQHLVRT